MAVAVWSAPLWGPQDLQPFDKSGSVSTSSPRHCLWAGTVWPPLRHSTLALYANTSCCTVSGDPVPEAAPQVIQI